MSDASNLPPCECFTMLDSRPGGTFGRCDVCDLPEDAHKEPGRRTLSGGEIEELRRRMIVQIYETREAELRTRDSDGKSEAKPEDGS